VKTGSLEPLGFTACKLLYKGMKGVDTLGLAPHFNGTGYPQWKVLMEAYLQAKDLDVWRVNDEGMRNGTKKEKQFDVIAKSIILSSLDVGVFNRVFNCENAHELWKTIKEQNEGSKEVANERYGCLLKEFNTLSNLQMKMPNLCTHA
jgi:hypothetical protein